MIWVVGALAYLGFRLWYDTWKGPLSDAEIDAALGKLGDTHADARATIESFLRADDGKEFLMANLVKLHRGEVADPETGAMRKASDVMADYSKPFMAALMKRAGHPVAVARKVGPYLEAWNAPPDPGWTIAGFIRYRSRRDMIALATDPRFHAMHAFKIAATAETYAFPTQMLAGFFLSPRWWVGIGIALICALLS